MMKLLQESGSRWMSPEEQFQTFPSSRELRLCIIARPVWLVLSLVLREQGMDFANGIGIQGQMDNMRQAVAQRMCASMGEARRRAHQLRNRPPV